MTPVKISCGYPLTDGGAIDLIAAGVFENDRPLHGSAGLLDWRLAGRLSRLILDRKFLGSFMEMVLMVPEGRFSGTKILVEGLGASSRFTLRAFEDAASSLRKAVLRLDARRVALAVPGLHRVSAWGKKEGVEPSDAVKAFLMIMAAPDGDSRITEIRLLEEKGYDDDVLLGCHKARAGLKDKKIGMDIVESPRMMEGSRRP